MKPSEKRLLFALLGMLVLGGIVIGSDSYFDQRNLLLSKRAALEDEWVVIETLFEEKDLWEARAEWLRNNQPPFTSGETIDQEIYQEALAEKVSGVTTSKLSLLPTLTTPEFIQAGVSLTASGELPDVFRWIYELNRPEGFRVIRNLKVQPDKESPEKILATFDFLRWYAPPQT